MKKWKLILSFASGEQQKWNLLFSTKFPEVNNIYFKEKIQLRSYCTLQQELMTFWCWKSGRSVLKEELLELFLCLWDRRGRKSDSTSDLLHKDVKGPRVKEWDNCHIGENIQVSYKASPHRTSYSMNRTKPLSKDRVELLLISQTKIKFQMMHRVHWHHYICKG